MQRLSTGFHGERVLTPDRNLFPVRLLWRFGEALRSTVRDPVSAPSGCGRIEQILRARVSDFCDLGWHLHPLVKQQLLSLVQAIPGGLRPGEMSLRHLAEAHLGVHLVNVVPPLTVRSTSRRRSFRAYACCDIDPSVSLRHSSRAAL
jgi:hypothetical protein